MRTDTAPTPTPIPGPASDVPIHIKEGARRFPIGVRLGSREHMQKSEEGKRERSLELQLQLEMRVLFCFLGWAQARSLALKDFSSQLLEGEAGPGRQPLCSTVGARGPRHPRPLLSQQPRGLRLQGRSARANFHFNFRVLAGQPSSLLPGRRVQLVPPTIVPFPLPAGLAGVLTKGRLRRAQGQKKKGGNGGHRTGCQPVFTSKQLLFSLTRSRLQPRPRPSPTRKVLRFTERSFRE
ncbi:uncharacterized protein LOC118829658 [Trichosurus vulpecula]|uniref:uncharacterized protein LOC118829658 n=1 Tax=Trichosurus vulpecula TaxID=9337 RepID=UPI00186B2FF5|nr:uncharacterized protein LOC118829658 [Trichosurus vulpecula]